MRRLAILVLGLTSGSFCAAAPLIGPVTPLTSGPIEKYARFEASFHILDSSGTNPYWPYDVSTPPSVPSGTGITVNASFLPPSEGEWANAEVQPCFYYQPMEELGSGNDATFLPTGDPEWRVRFAPDEAGEWQFKIQAVDAGGAGESSTYSFICTDSGRKGFVHVSPTDWRWMEFSDGTPFVSPLINAESGNPLNGLSRLRAQIPIYATNGVRFIRWFPTGEGANYAIYPFGDEMLPAWGFGREGGADTSIDADTAAGKLFSFVPYPYSGQAVPAVPGAHYRLSCRVKVATPSVLNIHLLAGPNGSQQLVGDTGGAWATFVVEATNSSTGTRVRANVRESVGGGTIRVHSIVLQRDLTGSGDWGPNLLAHPDPDSYCHVDQRHARLLDEVFGLSDEHEVYHRIMMIHKNDRVFGRFNPDGTINATPHYERVNSGPGEPSRWYQEAWWRYVIARWSCSPSLHSVEFANENDPNSARAHEAGHALADYFHQNCPRPILVSNSFWHSFPMSFWSDPRMDVGDEHAYLNNSGNPPSSPYHSHSIDDSALSTRQCWEVLKGYGLNKPVLRGETGVFNGHWSLGWYPDLALDTDAVYEHKKLWAHVGLTGYLCDGQWNTTNLKLNNNWKMYGAYGRFMEGEPVSNGHHEAIGTDLSGDALIFRTTTDLRAWGMRDTISGTYPGRALLWVDNTNHTWRNVVDGAAIPAVTGGMLIPGLASGVYHLEWWDTAAGAPAATESALLAPGSLLELSVQSLETDTAVKLRNTSDTPPTIGFLKTGSEGLESDAVFEIWVGLSATFNYTVTVDYSVAGGSAEGEGVDYILTDGSLVFSPGEQGKPISIQVLNDEEDETNETVILALDNASYGFLGSESHHTFTILDNITANASMWVIYH